MPDIFVPADTSDMTPYFREVAGRNILYRFTLDYTDRHRAQLNGIRTLEVLSAPRPDNELHVRDTVARTEPSL